MLSTSWKPSRAGATSLARCCGVRVSVRGRLAAAQLHFHVDVNVADPIVPAPGRLPFPDCSAERSASSATTFSPARWVKVAGNPRARTRALDVAGE
jgi:hypothetical protein